MLERLAAAVPHPRRTAAAALLPLAWFVQLLLWGGNTGIFALVAAMLNLCAALLVLLLLPPPDGFWRRGLAVLSLLLLALGWAILPEIASNLAAGLAGPRLVPDMLGTQVVRYMAVPGALLAGALLGYRRGMMRSAVDALLVLAALDLLIGLVLWQLDPHHVWGVRRSLTDYRFSGTLLNANASACISAMVAVLACGKWQAQRAIDADPLHRGGARLAALWAVLVLAGLGATLIAGSRTATALALLCILALLGMAALDRRGGASRTLALALPFAGALALLLLVAGGTVLARAFNLQEDALDRVSIWSHYWNVAQTSPWFGYGLNGFAEANLRNLGDPLAAREFWYINAAHNSLLHMLIEGGWPFLLLSLAAVAVALAQVAAYRRRAGGDPLVRGIGAALAVLAGCSLTDIALSVPAAATFGAILLGLVWGRALRIAADRSAGPLTGDWA